MCEKKKANGIYNLEDGKENLITKNMKHFLIILEILFMGCSVVEYESLSLKKTNYDGKELAIDGYFYQIGLDGIAIYNCCIHYHDGTYLNIGGNENSLDTMDQYIKDHYYGTTRYKKNQSNWGIFIITNNEIMIEQWNPDYPHYAYIREGVILSNLKSAS
ncbi:hypothetical protein FACS189413_17030 [Bacteroidia bacterium]|nr:hypothetical protein FACS189413_17030 [Bacteroidia bacterium]